MTQTLAVTPVRDMYGRRYFVRSDDLSGTRTQLRLCTEGGVRLQPPAHDESRPMTLHRRNICPHADDDFADVTILGDTWTECMRCRKQVEDSIARMAAERALA